MTKTLLLIDTSRDEALVALVKDDDVVAERRWENEPGVGRKVLGAIDELLREEASELKSVDRVAVNAGPGIKYSSLRSGVMVASMLAYATGARLAQITGQDVIKMAREALEAEPLDVVRPVYKH